MSASGLSGGIAAAVDSFRPSLVARSTGHQALLFGVSSALGYGVGASIRSGLRLAGVRHSLLAKPWARASLFVAATAASAPIIVRRAAQEREAHADWGVDPMRPGIAAAQGTAVAATLVGGTGLFTKGIQAAGSSASDRIGGPAPMWSAATVAAGAGTVAYLAPRAKATLFERLTEAGATPDNAFTEPPENPFVSGSADSLVPYDTHAREGSRFVHLASTAEQIEQVTEQSAMDPIRVFVGVSAGSTPKERVDLALAELERLGAFERGVILAVSPAGTGYANPVPVEALELMLGGDVATVVVQYGVLPSMFSGPALPDAIETYRVLVDALAERHARVLSYGESLGAQAAQRALTEEPSRWREDGTFDGIDAALFVGTPAGTGIRRSAEHRPAVFVVDRWQDLPTPVPPEYRVFLLDHDADPVTRFETPLVWTRPDWLAARPRGRGVPDQMAWRPLLTWMQVGLDVARATQPQLGVFQSHGHDYRADLAPLVRAAFAPRTSATVLHRVIDQLMASELRRSELLEQ